MKIDEGDLPEELKKNVFLTTIDNVYNWGRVRSMWPMAFGLACCAIEFMAMMASRFDLSRFGMEIIRASPRQADLMFVSGTVTKKMVPNIVRLYNQMAEPKYVLAVVARLPPAGRSKRGTTSSPASTNSFRSTSTCRAARPRRRRSCMACSRSTRKSSASQSAPRPGIVRISSTSRCRCPSWGPDLYNLKDYEGVVRRLRLESDVMNAQSVLEAGSYEQTLLRIVRSLPTYQRAQLLDVAVLLEKRRRRCLD